MHLGENEGKYPEALKAVNAAVKLAPSNQSVLFLRGQVLQKLGRTEKANAEFDKAKKLMAATEKKDEEDFGQGVVPNPELKQGPE